MKNSWTSKGLLSFFLILWAGLAAAAQPAFQQDPPASAQSQEPPAGEAAQDMPAINSAEEALAIDMSQQFGEVIKALRAYQPEDALARLEASELPPSMKSFLTGWIWHQKGDYERASHYFHQVTPEDLGSDNYFANRLVELRKTADALKSFEFYETENFSFRFKKGADRVMLYFLPEVLERAYAQFSELFGYTREEKIIVELMPDHELFSYASALTRSQIETTGTIALCVENRLAVLTPRRVARGYYWPDVISHEFIHYIVTKQSYDNVPLWMHEGLAKHFEARWENNALQALEPALEHSLALAVAEDEFLTVDQMMPSFAALPTADLARQAYAQTASMMEYIAELKGEAALFRLVKTLHDTPEINDALQTTLDMDFDAFESSWRSWAKRQGYRTHGNVAEMGVSLLDGDQTPEEQLKDVEAQDKTYKKHVRLGDLLLERNRYQAALKEYAKAPSEKGAMDRQLLLRMLRCVQNLRRPNRVIELIEENTTQVENDVTMLVFKAEALIELSEHVEAEALLQRAVRVNPFNPGIYRLWLSFKGADAEPAEKEKLRAILDILTHPQKDAPESKETKS